MRWYTGLLLYWGGTGFVHTPGHAAITSTAMIFGLFSLNHDIHHRKN